MAKELEIAKHRIKADVYRGAAAVATAEADKEDAAADALEKRDAN